MQPWPQPGADLRSLRNVLVAGDSPVHLLLFYLTHAALALVLTLKSLAGGRPSVETLDMAETSHYATFVDRHHF